MRPNLKSVRLIKGLNDLKTRCLVELRAEAKEDIKTTGKTDLLEYPFLTTT